LEPLLPEEDHDAPSPSRRLLPHARALADHEAYHLDVVRVNAGGCSKVNRGRFKSEQTAFLAVAYRVGAGSKKTVVRANTAA